MNLGNSRRNCEVEGYSADLLNLEKKINFYNKYTLKLKELVEEDEEVAKIFNKMKIEINSEE